MFKQLHLLKICIFFCNFIRRNLFSFMIGKCLHTVPRHNNIRLSDHTTMSGNKNKAKKKTASNNTVAPSEKNQGW